MFIVELQEISASLNRVSRNNSGSRQQQFYVRIHVYTAQGHGTDATGEGSGEL